MQQFVFIGGMERSGANMLRRILNTHPQIAAGPETNIIEQVSKLYSGMMDNPSRRDLRVYLSDSQIRSAIANLVREVFLPYADKKGAAYLVDCTPRNLWSFPLLAHILPSAKFLNIIRDGRDVACSYRDVGARAKGLSIELDPVGNAAASSIERCAALWGESVRFGWDHCGPDSALARDGRAFTTFYENIVISPESQIRNICNFLGLEFNQAMLHPERAEHDAIIDEVYTLQSEQNTPISFLSAGRWIDHLSLKDRILFYARGHVGLRLAGYEEYIQWLFRGLHLPIEAGFEALEEARREILGEDNRKGDALPRAPYQERASRLAAEKSVVESAKASRSEKALPEIEAILRIAKQSGSVILPA